MDLVRAARGTAEGEYAMGIALRAHRAPTRFVGDVEWYVGRQRKPDLCDGGWVDTALECCAGLHLDRDIGDVCVDELDARGHVEEQAGFARVQSIRIRG